MPPFEDAFLKPIEGSELEIAVNEKGTGFPQPIDKCFKSVSSILDLQCQTELCHCPHILNDHMRLNQAQHLQKETQAEFPSVSKQLSPLMVPPCSHKPSCPKSSLRSAPAVWSCRIGCMCPWQRLDTARGNVFCSSCVENRQKLDQVLNFYPT